MSTLAFIDTETTGLDARIHQPYEVCYWREDEPEPLTLHLPHSLEFADQQALKVGGYLTRGFRSHGDGNRDNYVTRMVRDLNGVTLVGSNPAFDAAMLTRFIGAPVWKHRTINVADRGSYLFGWEEPRGLADVTTALRDRGHDIPEPDHTAEGDVRCTRAVYYALREERGRLA